MVVYWVYFWFLRFQLFNLIKSYFKIILKVSSFKMVKVFYNLVILIIILELGMEEYNRVRRLLQFFAEVSFKTKVRQAPELY